MGIAEKIEDLKRTLDYLVELDNSKSYISIRNALFEFAISIPFREIPENRKFYRTRLNLEGLPFENVREISNNFSINKIHNFGRTNEPFQSTFYCSQDDITAYSETSSIIRNGSNNEYETYTTGIWTNKRPLILAYLPFPDELVKNSDTAKRLNEELEKHFTKTNFENKEVLLAFYTYLSSKFYNSDFIGQSSYFISTAFYNYVTQDERIDGLIFPSIQSKGTGINISLKKNLIMNNEVIIENAVERTFKRISKYNYQELPDQTKFSKSIDQKDWTINWP